jgi:hypothetical protein
MRKPLTETQKAKKRLYSAALYLRQKAADPDRVRALRRKARRKAQGAPITDEQRFGECPICLKWVKLYLDHSHTPPYNLRGWVCNQCNRGLGMLGDTLVNVRRAAAYLEVPIG